MKQFIAFVRKEFFHIFRDRRTMLILLGMPVVQIILFGFAITTEVKNVRVALSPVDHYSTVTGMRSEYFSVTTNILGIKASDGEKSESIFQTRHPGDHLYLGPATLFTRSNLRIHGRCREGCWRHNQSVWLPYWGR